MRVLRVLEVTMRDGNTSWHHNELPHTYLYRFRSDYEGWKPGWVEREYRGFKKVLEVTMRDGNTNKNFRNFHHIRFKVLEVTMRDGN